MREISVLTKGSVLINTAAILRAPPFGSLACSLPMSSKGWRVCHSLLEPAKGTKRAVIDIGCDRYKPNIISGPNSMQNT